MKDVSRTNPAPPSRRRIRLAVAAFAALAAARPARAAFDNPLITPQAAAMGGASLANTGDSAALFLNPAAGAGLRYPEAYFMYNQMFAGLPGVGGIGQGLAAAGVPTRYGTFVAGFGDFEASGLLQERQVGLSWSRRLFGIFDAGVTGKYLSHNYLVGSDPAANDPVFAHGTARSAFALDAGVIVPLTASLKAGLAVRNVNEPDVGLAGEDRVPREVQAGLSYDVKPWDLRLTADYVHRDVPSGTFSDRSLPSVGLEKGFVDGMVKFRLGATTDQFSGGIGLRFGPIDFDYAFILTRGLISNNAGTQQVGLRYRFGGSAVTPASASSESAAAVTSVSAPVIAVANAAPGPENTAATVAVSSAASPVNSSAAQPLIPVPPSPGGD